MKDIPVVLKGFSVETCKSSLRWWYRGIYGCRLLQLNGKFPYDRFSRTFEHHQYLYTIRIITVRRSTNNVIMFNVNVHFSYTGKSPYIPMATTAAHGTKNIMSPVINNFHCSFSHNNVRRKIQNWILWSPTPVKTANH